MSHRGFSITFLNPNVSNAIDRAGFISLKISVLWILVYTFQSPLIVTLQNCPMLFASLSENLGRRLKSTCAFRGRRPTTDRRDTSTQRSKFRATRHQHNRPGSAREPEQFWLFRSASHPVLSAFGLGTARNPLGHVAYYAPALACKLRLVLHRMAPSKLSELGCRWNQ